MRLEKNPSDKLIKLPDSASALSNGLIAADCCKRCVADKSQVIVCAVKLHLIHRINL
jgi:hypothetical protein